MVVWFEGSREGCFSTVKVVSHCKSYDGFKKRVAKDNNILQTKHNTFFSFSSLSVAEMSYATKSAFVRNTADLSPMLFVLFRFSRSHISD